MADLNRHMDFKRWAARRPLPDRLDESLWDRMVGRGKTSLDDVEATRGGKKAAGLIGKAAKVAANPIGAGVEFFSGLATAALSGNLGEAWEKIQEVVGVFRDVGDIASAGSAVVRIQKHKSKLAMHLREVNNHEGMGLKPNAIEGILQAVFEIDREIVAIVPPIVWPKAVKQFLAGLDGGYGNLGSKTFASVLYQAIIEAFSSLESHAQSLKSKVDEYLSAFEAPDIQKVLQVVEQAAGGQHEPYSHGNEGQGQRGGDGDQTGKAEKRIPKDGDRAYSRYHGYDFEGILADVQIRHEMFQKDPETVDGMANLLPYPGQEKTGSWGYGFLNTHHTGVPVLGVAYDEPFRWDPARNMWHAPAAYD